jgi:hypothetical protein
MKQRLRRIRGAVGMGLTWAVGWAVIGGAVMEGLVDPHGKILDMWPQTLAIPGFLGGVVFAVVLWIAARHRRFDELSLSRFSGLGAVAGLLLGVLAVGTGAASGVLPLWLRAAVIIGPMTLLSAASACGSLVLARRAERRQLPDVRPEVAAVGVAEREAQDLPGGRR